MFTVSVYAEKPAVFVGHKQVFALDRLTPQAARDILKISGLSAGAVYHDEARLPSGDVGTLCYRVYKSGRVRRYFWPMLNDFVPSDDAPF